MKIARVHIRTNGKFITGIKVWGTSKDQDNQQGTQEILKIEPSKDVKGLAFGKSLFQNIPQEESKKDSGAWSHFSIQDDEELLGFQGVLDSVCLTTLGIIKWRPPSDV